MEGKIGDYSNFKEIQEDIIFIKGDSFIKGNIEEVWEHNYYQENKINFEIPNGEFTLKMATYSKVPSSSPKAVVIYFHGMGSYMRTSSLMAKKICEENIAVYGYDLRGHGKSEGKRFYFQDVEALINDSILFIAKIREIHPKLPVFLGGNSLGGQIVYKISLRNPGIYKGVFLLTPALKQIQNICTYYTVLCMASIFPCLSFPISDPSKSSNNAYSIEKTNEDPYINKGSTPFASIKAILQGMNNCDSTFPSYRENFIIFLGGGEKIVSIEAILDLMRTSPSKRKKLYYYDKMYHNVLVEDECFDVIRNIVTWLKDNI